MKTSFQQEEFQAETKDLQYKGWAGKDVTILYCQELSSSGEKNKVQELRIVPQDLFFSKGCRIDGKKWKELNEWCLTALSIETGRIVVLSVDRILKWKYKAPETLEEELEQLSSSDLFSDEAIIQAQEHVRGLGGRLDRRDAMWALHNLVAHPLGEVLFWFGILLPPFRKFFHSLGEWLHDATVPN